MSKIKQMKHKKRRLSAPVVKALKSKQQNEYRWKKAEQQDYYCEVCKTDLLCHPIKNWHLDHNHKNGYTRGVLCAGCNRSEGKIKSVISRFLSKHDMDFEEFAKNLCEYWFYYENNPSYLLHPKHKTKIDKRLRQINKSKKKRESKKRIK